jgi:sugar lactone lactonase YvrE
MRALRVALVLLPVVVIGAGIAWWSWSAANEVVPLERDWSAVVTVLAGDGVAEWRDGEAYRARFTDPFGVAAAADGTVYVADGIASHRIRAISPDGSHVTTLAGGMRGFADGSGSEARFDTPSGLAVAPDGTIYVADTGNNAVRSITPDGIVTTIAGNGTAGFRDGASGEALFNGPVGVAVSASGRVFVADTYNDKIRVVEPDGRVATFAPDAVFNTPSGVAVDASGRVYVADTRNRVVQQIDPSGASATAFGFATLSRPVGIAIAPDGDVYVTDERGGVVVIHPDGSSRTVAGSVPGFRDGPGLDARFRRPTGIAFAGPGRLIVADAGNALVRLVAAPSRLAFRAPPAPHIEPQFDIETFRAQPLVWPVEPIEGPHEIAGTVGEARGGEGGERMHLGIDVRADQGTVVYAVRDGTAASPSSLEAFSTLTETIALGPLTYIHIRAGRARGNTLFDRSRFVPTFDERGKLTDLRVRRGARFAAGEAVGTVNAFNHVHLNVGWSGEEYNALDLRLVQFEDSVPPVIAPRGIQLIDEQQLPIKERVRGRVVVRGPVQIVVDAWDQSNESRPGRRLGLYDLGYQVLLPDGTPAPGFEAVRHTMRFDRFTIDPDAARLVYASGSGIPFYGNRRTRFLYTVTNTLKNGVAARGVWDATQLPPADYVLRVWAADVNGNIATANRDLAVTVAHGGDGGNGLTTEQRSNGGRTEKID